MPPKDIVLMEILSREYGWTPKEIRELSLVDLRCYVQIISTRNKLEKRLEKQSKIKRNK